MTAGRPLRFLAAVLALWVGARAAWLWPGGGVVAPAIGAEDEHPVVRRSRPSPTWLSASPRSTGIDPPPAKAVHVRHTAAATRLAVARSAAATLDGVPAAQGPPPSPPPPAPFAAAVGPLPWLAAPSAAGAGPLPWSPAPAAGRWAGSGWAILRDGGGARDFAGGRLGAAQAGVRLTYALDAARRLALAGRVSSPVEGRGREAALGVEWRPTRLPVRLLAEQRLALDRGARSGSALSLVGGIDPLPVAAGFRLEGYAQGGVARLGAFADGAAWLGRPVARLGAARLDLGLGAWGGAQPGAARLDLGPGAALSVPVADRRVRFGLEWRQRVAGGAAPASGPALTIGSDF